MFFWLGVVWIAGVAGLLVAAPIVDRLQRLGSPLDASGLPRDWAAESRLNPGSGRVEASERRLPRPPAEGGRVLAPSTVLTVPTALAVPAAENHPGYGPPVWLKIPAIDVDTPVEPVGIAGGYYQTVRYRVGHHADSAQPGALGNAIFNGHVTSLTEGRVLERLSELAAGDTFSIATSEYQTDWEVVAAGWLPADEDWYIRDTWDIRATLYTCGGVWDWLARDYTHRYVVIAGLTRAVPLDGRTAGKRVGNEAGIEYN